MANCGSWVNYCLESFVHMNNMPVVSKDDGPAPPRIPRHDGNYTAKNKTVN